MTIHGAEFGEDGLTQKGLARIVRNDSGRRMKALAMTGIELWDMFSTKIQTAALFPMLLRRRKANQLRAKLFAAGLFPRMLKLHAQKVLRAKVHAVGLMPMLLKAKKRRMVALKIFATGLFPRLKRKPGTETVKPKAGGGGLKSLAGVARGVKAALPKIPKYDGPKMKNVHWNVMTARDLEGTFWSEEKGDDGEDEFATSVFGTLGMEFEAKAAAPKKVDTGPPKQAIVSKLDPKRTQNIAIAVSRVWKSSFDELAVAILKLDIKAIGAGSLESLSKILPTAEEVGAVKTYAGEEKWLNKADQFVRAVGVVPQLAPRVEAMLFKTQFAEFYNTVKKQVDIILKASQEMMGNQSFQRLLKLLLKAGNTLNQGTRKAAAQGIKLDGLKKLTQTKVSEMRDI
jgi:hypothetical protein